MKIATLVGFEPTYRGFVDLRLARLSKVGGKGTARIETCAFWFGSRNPATRSNKQMKVFGLFNTMLWWCVFVIRSPMLFVGSLRK